MGITHEKKRSERMDALSKKSFRLNSYTQINKIKEEEKKKFMRERDEKKKKEEKADDDDEDEMDLFGSGDDEELKELEE